MTQGRAHQEFFDGSLVERIFFMKLKFWVNKRAY